MCKPRIYNWHLLYRRIIYLENFHLYVIGGSLNKNKSFYRLILFQLFLKNQIIITHFDIYQVNVLKCSVMICGVIHVWACVKLCNGYVKQFRAVWSKNVC